MYERPTPLFRRPRHLRFPLLHRGRSFPAQVSREFGVAEARVDGVDDDGRGGGAEFVHHFADGEDLEEFGELVARLGWGG